MLDATTVLANMEPDIAHQIKSVSKADRDALLMKCASVECDHLPEHYDAVCHSSGALWHRLTIEAGVDAMLWVAESRS